MEYGIPSTDINLALPFALMAAVRLQSNMAPESPTMVLKVSLSRMSE